MAIEGANGTKNFFDKRQIAQQAGTAIALHHFVDGTAKVDVHDNRNRVLHR